MLWQAGGAGRSRGRTGPGCLNHCGAVGRSSLMGAGTGLRIGMLSGPRNGMWPGSRFEPRVGPGFGTGSVRGRILDRIGQQLQLGSGKAGAFQVGVIASVQHGVVYMGAGRITQFMQRAIADA